MAITQAQSKVLAQSIADGAFDDDDIKKQQALRLVQQTNTRRDAPVIDNARLTEQEQRRFEADQEGGLQIGRALTAAKDAVVGTSDVALTIANSAIVEPLAGLAGLGAATVYGLYKWDASLGLDTGANVTNALRDALTFAPRSDEGQRLLEGVASKLAVLDEGADKIAVAVSKPFGDSPLVQTLVYSTLLGLPDVLGFKGGRLLRLGELNRRIKEVTSTAEKLGINLKPDKFSASIIEAAENMTDGRRAANAPQLQQALEEALQAKKAETAAITQAASQRPSTRAFVSVEEAGKFSKAAREELLLDGFELDTMPNVTRFLDKLDNLHTRSPTGLSGTRVVTGKDNVPIVLQQLNLKKPKKLPSRMVDRQIQDVDLIRNQIVKQSESGRKLERSALNNLSRKMDDWLDQQFHTDMIRGKPEDLAAWKDFHSARRAVTEVDKPAGTDRIIQQLITRGATAEEIYRWTVGANKAGVPRAARVIDRIKELIGPEHPAIKGIRTDMMFEMALPLFDTTKSTSAAMNGFIRNLNKMKLENSSLFKSLDVNMSAVTELESFAKAARNIELSTSGLKRMSRSLTAFLFGHGIAKGGAIMRTLFGPVYLIMRGLAGQTLSAKKALIYNLSDANYRTPAINPRNRMTGLIVENVFRADIQDAAKDDKSVEQ